MAANQDKKEINIGKPQPFTGERANARTFLEQVQDYLEINDHVYDNDKKQIIFALSFMPEGEAADWASAKRQEARSHTPTNYGTLANFILDFKKSFISVADTAEARNQLMRLRQGSLTVDEYNTKFKTLITRAEYKEPDEHCEIYRRGLQPNLMRSIAKTGSLPTTLAGWYTKASQIDNAEREIQAVLKELDTPSHRANKPKTNGQNQSSHATPAQGTNYKPRLNKLTPEERERCIKLKLCFRCRQPGHMGPDCPVKNPTIRAADTTPVETKVMEPVPTPNTQSSEEAPADPMDPVATIRRLMAQMNTTQKEEFLADMEKEGF